VYIVLDCDFNTTVDVDSFNFYQSLHKRCLVKLRTCRFTSKAAFSVDIPVKARWTSFLDMCVKLRHHGSALERARVDPEFWRLAASSRARNIEKKDPAEEIAEVLGTAEDDDNEVEASRTNNKKV
jgi:hypothetical protein